MTQNIELQNLDALSEETLFEQSFNGNSTEPLNIDNFPEPEEAEFGFCKRKYFQFLTFLRQNYLKVIKILFFIVLILLVLLITVSILKFKDYRRETEAVTSTEEPSLYVSAWIPMQPTSTTGTPWTKSTTKTSMISASRAADDFDVTTEKLPPSKPKTCKKIRCADQVNFIITRISVAQLTIYGCCKSPPKIEFKAVTKVKERFDLIYTSKIISEDYLPKLVNLTGSWAKGSFNDELMYVYRGVGLVPPDPDLAEDNQ